MLAEGVRKLESYLEQNDYAGYDPYDALNGPFLKFFAFNIPRLRLYYQQAFRRLPINFRALFGVPHGRNPKGIGLIAYGYLNLYEKTKDEQYKNKAIDLLEWLDQNSSKQGHSGHCWGYNFDWQSRAFFLPKGTPTVVNTSFIGKAFVKAYEVLSERRYLDIARSACDFILKDLNRSSNSQSSINNPQFATPLSRIPHPVSGILHPVNSQSEICNPKPEISFCFSYSPIDKYFVHNATALASSLLALVYGRTGEKELYEVARRSILYVVNHQQENGFWFYGEDEVARKTGIDNFHTGFVLESLKIYAEATNDHSFDENIKKGLKFYQENFFLPDGAPKYFHNKIFPLDIHSAAQAIVTLIQLRDYGADMDLCDRVVNWMIKNMWDEKRGYFYYQKGRFITNKIPYLRWSQAWAFYALSMYLNYSNRR
ncbi:MAG: delta-aminolevulinic acid dehydratase [candidate division WOR-3 bacterium]